MRQREGQLGEKVLGGEEPLHAMTLVAARIDDEDRRSPLRAETRTQPLELVGLIPHVDAHGNELVGDELRNLAGGIHLGIQPSAAASHGCSAEIEQDVPIGARRVRQCGVEIVPPGDVVIFSHSIRVTDLGRADDGRRALEVGVVLRLSATGVLELMK
jgi:hypothetical protein